MDIILLAAGSSSRMGKTNKLLLPLNNTTMVANSAMQALKFLEETQEGGSLIVVTGYRHKQTEKALKECVDYVCSTNSKIKLIIVNNPDYKNGQFSSTKKGVEQVSENSSFFIQLADMPLIKAEHYKTLVPHLKNKDAVRPFYDNQPGHPVLLSAKIKEAILKHNDSFTVSKILSSFGVNEIQFTDSAFIKDIDTPQDLS